MFLTAVPGARNQLFQPVPVPIIARSNSGLTSAPRWPHTWQVNFGSRSESRTRSGPTLRSDYDRMRAFVIAAIDDEPGRAVQDRTIQANHCKLLSRVPAAGSITRLLIFG